ncbi:hypothetical protein K461DRAFT_279783 [Myriangium duriaei CBS 260.36]|uniref:NACHT domain-containing protein n=1 Tax=Myriangium duriaei CBS 260.36 TaxID=1168546 RepID=A0A9P4J248_9PEZI|nr:hypothetical protein K461DRAFT_279783 [Myriangium duriaei CBS 260.36]
MYHCFSSCIFFGTPFRGADIARTACIYATVSTVLGHEWYTSLLRFMSPSSPALAQLIDELRRLETLLNPKIEFYCIYETQRTDFAKFAKISWLSSIVKRVAKEIVPKNLQFFVSQDSSTLDGIENHRLHRSHCDLVRFKDRSDHGYCDVLLPRLEKMVGHAATQVLERLEKVDGEEEHNVRMTREAKERAFQQRHKKLLDSLFFSEIDQRYDQIFEAEKTFEWIFGPEEQSEWSSLPAWLQGTEKFYWISGKPGSGKSTLMRWLLKHDETRRLADKSDPGRKVVILSHFFFLPGSANQNSILGLVKSLLYKVLEKIPDLTENLNALADRTPTWTLRSTLAALTNVLGDEQNAHNFLLFIDGLDECNGAFPDLLKVLNDLGTLKHTKIIVSSRPHMEFRNRFRQTPTLRLQDLTRADIEQYVSQRLERAFVDSRPSIPSHQLQDLIEESARRSDGVFLWVKFAMDSVCQGMCFDDPMEILLKRLNSLPTELEDMFAHMLSQIQPYYQEIVSNYFKLRIQAVDQLLVLELVLCNATGLLGQPRLELKTESLKTLSSQCDLVAKRISAISNGILELLPNTSLYLPNDHTASMQIQFVHRSAFDYMKSHLYKGRGDQLDEKIDRALVFASISMLRFVGDPDFSWYLREHVNSDYNFSTFRYLRKYQHRRYYETSTCIPDRVLCELEASIDDGLSRINGNVLTVVEELLLPNVIKQILLETFAHEGSVSKGIKLTVDDDGAQCTSRLNGSALFAGVQKLLIETGLAALIQDSLRTVSPETATKLLHSSIRAFHSFDFHDDIKPRWITDAPSYDHVALVASLLERGADPNCRATYTHPKGLDTTLSALGHTLAIIEPDTHNSDKDKFLRTSKACLPMLEVLVKHNANIDNEHVHFQYDWNLYVVMNLTAFACYQSTQTSGWENLVSSLWTKHPIVVCKPLVITVFLDIDGFGVKVNQWMKAVMPQFGNSVHAEDNKSMNYLQRDQQIIIPWSHGFRGVNLHEGIDIPAELGSLNAIVNSKKIPQCPYQPSVEELTTLVRTRKGLEEFGEVTAREYLSSFEEEHGCLHYLFIEDGTFYIRVDLCDWPAIYPTTQTIIESIAYGHGCPAC